MILKVIGFFAIVYIVAQYLPEIFEVADNCLGKTLDKGNKLVYNIYIYQETCGSSVKVTRQVSNL